MFVIIIITSYYEYQSYSELTNEFVNNVVELISNNYPDIDTSEIIKIINDDSSYSSDSNILTTYGFTDSDLSVLTSIENNFYEQLLLKIVLIVFGLEVLYAV